MKTFLLASLASMSLAHAAVLVNADFDTGYTAGTSLNGQSGSGDVGLAGTWTATNGITVVSGGLTYNVAGGGTIQGGANAMQFAYFDTATLANPVYRSLSPTVNSSTIYVRMVVQPVDIGTNQFAFWWLDSNNTSNHLADAGLGAYAAAPGAKLTSGTTATFGSFAEGQTYLLVAQFNKDGVSGQYEAVNFWLNPDYSDSASPDATATDASGALSNASYIGFGFNNMITGAQYRFDSIAIGTTWNDVVPVPEPSAACLITTGLMGALFFRRRSTRP